MNNPHRFDRQDTSAVQVFTNGSIYTADMSAPTATTVVIDGSRIVAVGGDELLERYSGQSVHDLGGRAVIPGMVDAHTHPSAVSGSMWHTRLPWTSDIDELLAFMKAYAEEHSVEEAPFLYFEYYPTDTFRDRAPTKELLDSAVADRPVLCQDHSEHSHWVNTRMLELMGVTAETPDPLPGLQIFERDARGEPTGHIREMAYQPFIEDMYDTLGWRPAEDLTPERINPFFRFMTEHGVTALFEAVVLSEEVVASVAELDRRGELNMYYEGALRFYDLAGLPAIITDLKRLQATYGNEHISLNTLKLFLDGTNESGNSAVIAPLCTHGAAGKYGAIGLEVDELTDCLTLANSEGVDVHIHMVGDRAFRVGCDAVEAARTDVQEAGETWRTAVTFAHCELVDPADMGRPGQLGITINWTTHWSGGYFGEEAKPLFGDERWNRMYRFNEMADAGAILTFSSDVVTGYELHRGNPFFGMQVARTRVDPEFPLDPTQHRRSERPEESAKLSMDRLLQGYTINGAKQLRLENRTGSIAPGKSANLVVLSADPFYVDPADTAEIHCDAVVFEGRLVAGDLPPARP